MYWVKQCEGCWQVMKGERVVCILLLREEAERLAEALSRLKLTPLRTNPALSFL